LVGNLIVLGRLSAPFGVQGWLRLHPFGDDPQSWREIEYWQTSRDADAPAAQWGQLKLAALKMQNSGPVVKFEGCDDRNAADGLVGLYVAVPRHALPDTGQDEYYWTDLVGLAVVNSAGVVLGRIDRLLETGANDVLVVVDDAAGGKPVERLIPFVSAVVTDVERSARVVRVEWDAQW
jgi:16S rRNA processing protein RimM